MVKELLGSKHALKLKCRLPILAKIQDWFLPSETTEKVDKISETQFERHQILSKG